MNKFLALLKKDWYASRTIMLIPIWWMLAMCLLMALSYLFMGNNSHVQIGFFDLNSAMLSRPELLGAAFYFSNYSQVLTTGMFCMIFGLILASSAMNRDYKKNCELFYRSQPVSLWAIAGSKYLINVLGAVVAMIVISIVIYIVYNGFVWAVFRLSSFQLATTALFQGLVGMSSVIVFFGSLLYLGSAAFKNHALGLSLAVVAGESLIAVIINGFLGTHFPSLISIFYGMVKEVFGLNQTYSWNMVLTMLFWKRWIISVCCFFAGALVYQLREIQQSN